MLDLPNALEVHWSDLHHVSNLLRLENAVPSTSGHAGNVQQLGSIDEMVV